VDLAAQTITTPSRHVIHFEIDLFRKGALLHGLDNIGWTLSHQDDIEAYEQRRKQVTPWVFA
jgi:3-isopropylmalate/(R)-2-methylmalate dehydratase small subunit